MALLSKPIDQLAGDSRSAKAKFIEVLVVGSGYGGAVAALRSAEEGLDTCVLERGREYLPGDFPRDIGEAPGHFRIAGGGETTGGYDHALFDVHVGDETVVLVGNGLGGGSLINASVALEADPRVFAQKAWPKAIADMPDPLRKAYDTATVELHATEYQDPAEGAPPKSRALERFACKVQSKAETVRITVNSTGKATTVPMVLQPCVGCGDCVSGCNYGAKATLGTTYLAKAFKAGAEFFTGATVLWLRPAPGGWRVRYVRTDDLRNYQRARARLEQLPHGEERAAIASLLASLVHSVMARTVVLAAGTLGSTEILARSAARGLALPTDRLGTRFSGNGDYLTFTYRQKEEVRAVGWGATGNASIRQPTVGPTITRVVFFPDADDVNKSFIVEDASVPGALADIFHELVTSGAVLPQLTRRKFLTGETNERDSIGLDPLGRSHTQIFLTMGHDGSGGRLRLDRDRIRVCWPTLDADSKFFRYDREQVQSEKLGGVYLSNPVWTPLPRDMERVLSGARLRGRDLIVHPLGGCPMADDAKHGVVNNVGAVFCDSSGTAVHAGLFVLDGSIVPTSLGVNPLLTITALAERAMPSVIAGRKGTPQQGRLPAEPEVPVLPAKPDIGKVPVELREVLRGTIAARHGPRPALSAKLAVRFPTPDMRAFLEDPRHRFAAQASLQLSATASDGSTCTWDYAERPGTVTILEPVRTRWARHASDTVQVLFTWLIERGFDDVFASPKQRRQRHWLRKWRLACDTLKLAWHAADRRQMQYRFVLTRTDGMPPHNADAWQGIVLEGRKHVYYAAQWMALVAYPLRRIGFAILRFLGARRGKAPPRLNRRNLWQSMTELDIVVRASGPRKFVLGRGRIAIAPVEMAEAKHSPRVEGETMAGLLAIVAYPMLFARYILKCRVWDFRLPSYAPMPVFDYPRARGQGPAALVKYEQRLPRLRSPSPGGSEIEPESYAFEVPLRQGAAERVKLVLWRYRNPLQTRPTADGMLQCRSIVLVHAFAQSAVSFAEPTLEVNLAEYLHRAEWDVWLLEHRISIGLDAVGKPCSMDDIAILDIPAAFDLCLGELRGELGLTANAHLQVFALAQCVGSATLAMAVLAGKLAYEQFLPERAPKGRFEREDRVRSKLAGVAFSQFTPYVIGHAGSQFRSFLPTVLRDVLGLSGVDFAAPGGEPDDSRKQFAAALGQTGTLIDRALATLPIPDAERCFGEHQGHALTQVHASCRRMWGVEAPLYSHANLGQATHDRLPLLLGKANIDVFLHARKCIDAERLVNADGLNVYVTQENIRRNLHMPVALLHGRRNALFAVGSSRRSYAMLRKIFTRDHTDGRLRLIVFPDHGHLDWMIGRDTHVTTYPKVAAFLSEAWQQNATTTAMQTPEVSDEPPKSRLLVPALGVTVGDVHRVDGHVVANVWLRPDESESGTPERIVAKYEHEKQTYLQHFSVRHQVVPLQSGIPGIPPAPGDYSTWLDLRYAVCPLKIPIEHLPENGDPLVLELHTVHRLPTNVRMDKHWENKTPLPPTPMTLDESLHYNNLGNYKSLRARLSNRMKAAEARIRRTTRSTLSRSQLRSRSDKDAMCEMRRGWAVAPPAGTPISILASCCRYPGFLFEQHRVDQAFRRMSEGPLGDQPSTRPAALLLLGDQIYADATAGFFDMTTPIEKFATRYEEFLKAESVRGVLSRIPTYMAIDDHEIADDWDVSHRVLDRPLADMALATARVYQWANSSGGGIAEDQPLNATPADGFSHAALIGGTIPLLMLDSRSRRDRSRKQACIVDPEAWQRLAVWLDAYGDLPVPKIIATGSPIAPGLKRFLDERYALDPYLSQAADNWQAFNDQRLQLLDLLVEKKATNVVLLGGDYHCAAVADVFRGNDKIATSIVAPPTYAPLAYANAKAADIAKTETLGAYRIELVPVTPAAFDGSGYARLDFARAHGKWSVDIGFELCNVCAGKDPCDDDNWDRRGCKVTL